MWHTIDMNPHLLKLKAMRNILCLPDTESHLRIGIRHPQLKTIDPLKIINSGKNE
jgi:hypothetical protein